MGESAKSVLMLVAMVAVIASAIGWVDDRPDGGTWCLRVLPLVGVALIAGLLLRAHFRPDLAPDLLRERAGDGYLNRAGLALWAEAAVEADPRTGEPTAVLVVPFQNQRDRPAEATVAVRGGRAFWLGRAGVDAVAFEVTCPPAACGEARVPIPVPADLHGREVPLEVGATVRRPAGRGGLVRFHHGASLTRDASFRDRGGCALTALGLLSGGFLFYRGPATVPVTLPDGVRETLGAPAGPRIVWLWDGWPDV